MDRPHRIPVSAAADDETLEASDLATSAAPSRQVHLVAGSQAGISAETLRVLRSRLRVAALLLSAGFGVFLVWDLLARSTGNQLERWLFGAHVLTSILLGVCGGLLCRKCDFSARMLHLQELAIFGLPALFFLFFQYVYLTECAAQRHPLPNVSGMWLILIFTYALFIPNSWQRAAGILGALAIAPVLLSVVLVMADQQCMAAPNAGANYLVQQGLMMLVGGITATVGVRTIGNLRRAAFAARQLGQYRLGRRLGGGGMGEVYLAEHQLMKRPCAIKVIRPDKTDDPRVLARFEREVRASAKLSHWNNIDIFDYGRADDGTFYYVMEFLPGLSLDDLVRRYGPLPAARVIYILLQTCDALSEAHTMGLIHRDIKPANLFAARRGGLYDVAKLLDFGLVKPILDADEIQLTHDGSITGSPLFMSPEQSLGEREPDARGDIYSLGAVAYFMLTGRPPFDYSRPMQVLFAHAQQEPEPPWEVKSSVPEDLGRVILRCLAQAPQDRYQDAQQLAEALRGCCDAGQWSRQDAARWWRQNVAAPKPEAAVT